MDKNEIEPKVLSKNEIVEKLTKFEPEELEKCMERNLCPILEDVILYQGTPGAATVKDTEGRVHIDFTSQAWTLGTGFCQGDVGFAAVEQIKHLTHTRNHYYTIPHIKLINRLTDLAPGNLKKVAFNNQGGSLAVEGAMKLAMASKPGASLFITAQRAYQGNTLATLGATQYMPDIVRFPGFGLEHFVKVPYPYCYRCPFGQEHPGCDLSCLSAAKNTIEMGVNLPIAGVIVEPIIGSGGDIVPPQEYLRGLRGICDDYDILLIFDESQTAFGRIGKMFAAEHFDVMPDIMALTKALGGGFPLGATLAREDLEPFTAGEFHTTFSSFPISFATALINLDVIERLNIPQKAREMGDYFMRRLGELQEKYRIIGDIRGVGLMIGVEFVKDRKTKEPATEEADEIVYEAKERGLICDLHMPIMTPKGEMIRNIMPIKPPIVITKEEADRGFEIFEDALKKVAGE